MSSKDYKKPKELSPEGYAGCLQWVQQLATAAQMGFISHMSITAYVLSGGPYLTPGFIQSSITARQREEDKQTEDGIRR